MTQAEADPFALDASLKMLELWRDFGLWVALKAGWRIARLIGRRRPKAGVAFLCVWITITVPAECRYQRAVFRWLSRHPPAFDTLALRWRGEFRRDPDLELKRERWRVAEPDRFSFLAKGFKP